MIHTRILKPDDVSRCADILHSLPGWFGIQAANEAYVESLSRLPGAVACVGGSVMGFIALAEQNPGSVEIHVMAVDPARHRSGLGRALIRWAEDWCRNRGCRWLHVKTRGPSTPDPEYERTRRFYLACGFEPLFESRTLWGPEDAALVLVKRLGPGRPVHE